MKNVKYLLLLLVAVFVIPFTVLADEEEVTEVSREVNVYVFRGDGCPHCADAEEWFQSIEEEYGSQFEVVDYETWYNEENAALMDQVAKARGEEPSGVPYIIIGNKSWFGFTDSYADEMLEEIKSLYETEVDERYDVMKLIENGNSTTGDKEEKSGNDVLGLIIILIIVAGCGFGIYKAREHTK